jgi:hypothetical protein
METAMHATRASRPSHSSPLGFELAEVIAVEGRSCTVRSATAPHLEARTAASCLVQPCPGDRVALLAVGGAEVPYVWAVLERPAGGPLGLAAPEGLSVSAPGGAVVISARDIDLLSRERLGMQGADLDIEAHQLRVGFQGLHASGTRATLHVEALRFIGKALTSVLERVLSRVQRSYRVVEEVEQFSGRHLDYQVSENLSLRGKNSLITAEELVRLDAKQLHLG